MEEPPTDDDNDDDYYEKLDEAHALNPLKWRARNKHTACGAGS